VIIHNVILDTARKDDFLGWLFVSKSNVSELPGHFPLERLEEQNSRDNRTTLKEKNQRMSIPTDFC
jgi:hypothetical protein